MTDMKKKKTIFGKEKEHSHKTGLFYRLLKWIEKGSIKAGKAGDNCVS